MLGCSSLSSAWGARKGMAGEGAVAFRALCRDCFPRFEPRTLSSLPDRVCGQLPEGFALSGSLLIHPSKASHDVSMGCRPYARPVVFGISRSVFGVALHANKHGDERCELLRGCSLEIFAEKETGTWALH
jgi:hypothetical protein